MSNIPAAVFYAFRYILCFIAVFVLIRCFVMLMRKKIKISSLGVLINAANGDEITIDNYETSIGRSKLCDIRLGYATVSRFHAVLTYRNGSFFVDDTNSKMGVYVNGVKIEKPTEVFNGDNIAFGNIPMKLVCKEQPEVEPLDRNSDGYVESVIADTQLSRSKPRVDTGELPNIYDGAYIHNLNNGAKMHLAGSCVVFGRDASQCDVHIDNPYISRVHTRLFIANGKWAVEDLNSSAGTFLNGERITRPQYLFDGDEVSVGNFSFVFRQGGAS